MSEEPESERSVQKKSASKSKSSGSSGWIVRIAVFGVLGVLLVLALLDFQTKRNFEASQTALQDLVDNESTIEEAEQALVGSPEMTEGKTYSMPMRGEIGVHIYVWNGIFRSYRLRVDYYKRVQTLHQVTSVEDAIEEEK